MSSSEIATNDLLIQDGFKEKVIIPYFRANQNEIEEMQETLLDGIQDFFDTPEYAIFGSSKISVNCTRGQLVDELEYGHTGHLILDIEVKAADPLNSYSLEQLTEFLYACNEWVRLCLGERDKKEWVDYVYRILVLWRTSPNFSSKPVKENMVLISRLLFGAIPPNLNFTPERLATIITEDLGDLSNRSYRFSPYGGLIYHEDYDMSKSYLESYVIPFIAKARSLSTYFELLNRFLTYKLDYIERSKNTEENYEELFSLRKSIVKALAAAESSQSFTRLTLIAEKISSLFGTTKLETVLQKKIDILNLIFERILNDRIAKLDSNLSKVNLVLAIIGALLAALAFPPIVKLLFPGS